MNLNEIEAKCFIMALFIRDDGLRFLLGTGAYEFKDSQLMFAGNTIENDVVPIQGNDGYMLAGQVRRPSTQVFNGYIGDATVQKAEVESYRRDFMVFFQKNHFYTVVYIMADGSAVQRRRGFLVDAPTSQEIWQMYPEYHVALNFEDVNYYKYSENDEGEETYAKSADIGLAKVQYGGLLWANMTQQQAYAVGTDISISGTIADQAVDYIDLYGDTQQQSYSGKNLLLPSPRSSASGGLTASYDLLTGIITLSGIANNNWSNAFNDVSVSLTAGTYTFSATTEAGLGRNIIFFNGTTNILQKSLSATSTSVECVVPQAITSLRLWLTPTNGTNYTGKTFKAQLESGSTPTSFEPYVGGTASPNPDYPQEVQTVTGEQTITISDGQGNGQVYIVNLGKNLCDGVNQEYWIGATTNMTYGRSSGNTGLLLPVESNTNYTISTTETQARYRMGLGDEILGLNGSSTIYDKVLKDGTSDSVTLNSGNHKYIVINATDLTKIQIEKGSTATTYAPYFTPIELCKIGDYQDYIYKSGSDWYVHKETNKLLANLTNGYIGNSDNYTNISYFVFDMATDAKYYNQYSNNLDYYCTHATPKSHQSGSTWDTTAFVGGISMDAAATRYWLGFKKGTSLADMKSTLAGMLVYYPLATPTDTQITNADLITQLEALNSATTYDRITWFKSSSVYLPAIMYAYAQVLAGGGVIWDNNGAEWEEGGGGEVVIVNVDSIENIFPVWTIRGKAENPTLTNLTTGMSITYNGTVASGQTLIIDLLNKTAKLNGTSVISDISGQWVEFQPGNNRVSYTTDNADAPNSTIEWQEVVG